MRVYMCIRVLACSCTHRACVTPSLSLKFDFWSFLSFLRPFVYVCGYLLGFTSYSLSNRLFANFWS